MIDIAIFKKKVDKDCNPIEEFNALPSARKVAAISRWIARSGAKSTDMGGCVMHQSEKGSILIHGSRLLEGSLEGVWSLYGSSLIETVCYGPKGGQA